MADTPLVRNLDNEEYHRIILNGCGALAERFAQIDEEMVRAEMKRSQTNENRISSALKVVIRKPDPFSQISDIFFNVGKKDANRLLPT